MRRDVSVGLMLALLVAGCGGTGDDPTKRRLEAVEASLMRLDKRLSDIEKALPATDTLRDAIRDVDRRMAALEQRVQAMGTAATAGAGTTVSGGTAGGTAAAGAATGGTAPANDAAMVAEARRRGEALAKLNQEYRQRLSQLRSTDADGRPVNMAELRAQRRDLSRWFREQRRLVLRGEPPATP